jgi:hypothetical protein
VQSGADFDDDAGAQGEVSAESIGKMIFPGFACRQTRNRSPSDAAGKILDQNGPGTLQREAVRPIRELQLENQNGNPG